jgi:hypothetical protein
MILNIWYLYSLPSVIHHRVDNYCFLDPSPRLRAIFLPLLSKVYLQVSPLISYHNLPKYRPCCWQQKEDPETSKSQRKTRVLHTIHVCTCQIQRISKRSCRYKPSGDLAQFVRLVIFVKFGMHKPKNMPSAEDEEDPAKLDTARSKTNCKQQCL